MSNKSVAYIYPFSFQYRAPFNEQVCSLLSQKGVNYDFIYSSDPKFIAPRGDLVSLPWASDVACTFWRAGGLNLRYQHAFWKAVSNDLVILQQENGLLLNYALLTTAHLRGKRTAFFGHGKNFQSAKPNGFSERWKRFWLTKVHWWFAYTEGSARVVEEAGFPRERITVFNNSIDTAAIRREMEGITPEEIDETRRMLGISSENIGIYIGGMYKEKRLDFLIEAARLIHEQVPEFCLLLVGAGIDASIAQRAAMEHDFIHFLGPKFGREKTTLALMSKVFLMPGLVGLAVLDSFAYGLPMITTKLPFHSPEIEYLEDGMNGIIIPNSNDVAQYAKAVALLLQDEDRRQELRAAALRSSANYSIEAMVDRFAEGVLKALE